MQSRLAQKFAPTVGSTNAKGEYDKMDALSRRAPRKQPTADLDDADLEI